MQGTLQSIEGEVVNIPLGQIFGSQILAYHGPKIPVTLIPIGTVHVDITHSFSEAGINQTRHKIYLEVFAGVQFVVPFISAEREVMTAVPIAETVYMGDVPNTVIDMPFPYKNEGGSSSSFMEGEGNIPYFNR